MKRAVFFLITALCALAWGEGSPGRGELAFQARGFAGDTGQAVIFLYREGDKIPKAPYRVAVGGISSRKSDLVFPDLPYGEYAAILLHDINGNQEIDHSLGIPSEPLGYTNGWKLGLFSGMPTFKKLKFRFSLTSPMQVIPIVFRKK